MTLTARKVLGVTRLSVGAVSLIAPLTSARIFGVTSDPASAAWITRLFGSRELALAAALLAAPDEQVQQVAAVGAAIDALDAASSAVELARGNISRYTFVSGGCGAVLFAVLGVVAMRGPRPSTVARQP